MTTLIKNGLLYDGTTDAPEKLDVLLQDDRIVRIGSLQKIKADHIIDATGAMICPGFIDINTHSDHYFSIFSDPLQGSFLRNGVTTIIGGNCGESLAPFSFSRKSVSTDWGHSGMSLGNIHWHDTRELFRVLQNKKFGVNFGTLVGYTTIRNFVTGGAMRDLTDSELELIKDIVRDALKDGVFGLSTGFERAHEEHIPQKEVFDLIQIVGECGAVYATHIKNFEKQLVSSIQEVLRIAEKTGTKIEISHLIPTKSYKEGYQEVQKLIEKETAVAHVHFDFPLFLERIVPIHYFLPKWAHDDDIEKISEHIVAPYLKKRIISHFSEFNLKNVRIVVAPRYLSSLVGKSLRDVAKNFGMSSGNTLLYLMQISNMTMSCAIEDVSKDTISDFITSPASIISSAGASFSLDEFSSISWENPLVLLSVFTKKQNIPFERILPKLTSIPAKKYGIERRGAIGEGYYADMIVAREGVISDVFVNGVRGVREGKLEDIFGGRTLRKIK